MSLHVLALNLPGAPFPALGVYDECPAACLAGDPANFPASYSGPGSDDGGCAVIALATSDLGALCSAIDAGTVTLNPQPGGVLEMDGPAGALGTATFPPPPVVPAPISWGVASLSFAADGSTSISLPGKVATIGADGSVLVK